jgi:hypothetical protein
MARRSSCVGIDTILIYSTKRVNKIQMDGIAPWDGDPDFHQAKVEGSRMNRMARGKRGQLIAGAVLCTLGIIFLLDRLFILEVHTSWPLILVAIGVALFISNPQTLAGWIVGGIGIILFVVYFVFAFFPEIETWSDLVWPIILILVGVLLLYRYFQIRPL